MSAFFCHAALTKILIILRHNSSFGALPDKKMHLILFKKLNFNSFLDMGNLKLPSFSNNKFAPISE